LIPVAVSLRSDHDEVKLAGTQVEVDVVDETSAWLVAVEAVAGGELHVDDEWPLWGLQAVSPTASLQQKSR
jgi:hypothetical protein